MDETSNAFPSEQQSVSSFRDLVLNFVLIAIISGLSAAAITLAMVPLMGDGDRPETAQFVLVDSERLAREQIEILSEKVRSGEMDSSEMPARSKAFTEGLMSALKSYTNAGTVVLRSVTVLAAPDSVRDVTGEIRNTLVEQGLYTQKNPVVMEKSQR